MYSVGADCIIPPSSRIEEGVLIGPRVILAGDKIKIQSNARIDAGSIIGEGVIVGVGAWVRAGSVVLHSVPANSIVEGNPARVVGYVTSSNHQHSSTPRLVDFQSLNHISPPPCKYPLEVGNSALYIMRQYRDSRGSLAVGEVSSEIPFTPQRFFVVYDVPSSELRGEHAHKECEQFLLCLNGSVRILLDDGISRCEVILDRPEMGVYMPKMLWGTQYCYSIDAVLLVFASMPYSAEDYIRNYDRFISLAALTSR
jgi:hypothetical protein